MNIDMTERDFESLTDSAMQWGESWRKHDGRFESHADGKAYDAPPSYRWKMAYWLGDNAAGLILARAYVTDQGFGSETIYDLAEGFEGYVLLTDYMTAGWIRLAGQ